MIHVTISIVYKIGISLCLKKTPKDSSFLWKEMEDASDNIWHRHITSTVLTQTDMYIFRFNGRDMSRERRN